MTAAKVQSLAELASLEIEDVLIHLLDVAPWNARKTYDQAALNELAETIKALGIQVPLLVRPKAQGRLEIVAGHRRFKVAESLASKTVPCIVRELSDDQAREIGLVDNLQREDLPALEEADAFGELLERLHSIPAVSARVGKEQSYIARRLKLLQLTVNSRDALREKLITIDHAMLLARLAANEQDEALKWCLDTQAGSKKPVADVIADRVQRRLESDDEDEEDDPEESARRASWRREWEPESVLRLKEHIECESGTPLDRAPWPMEEDWLAPEAGSCLNCPKNTKANAPLFGDLDIGVAVCTDGACFKTKTQAWIGHGLAIATKASGVQLPILCVSWKATSTEPRFEKVPLCKCGAGKNCKSGEGCRGVPKETQTFKDGQWEEATKKCEAARAAVAVDWSDTGDRGYMGNSKKLRKPGEIVQACIDPKCKVHPKSYGRPAKQSSNGRSDPAAEKAAEEKRKAAAIQENKLRMAFAAKALDGITTIPEGALRRLVCSRDFWGSDLRIAEALIPGFKKLRQTAATGGAQFAKVAALMALSELAANEYGEAKQGRLEFIASVRALGYNGPDPWQKPVAPKAEKKAAKKAPAKAAVKKTAAKAKKPAKKKGGR